ncbi:MAG: NUDIX hydrolase [Alphaproteobacteria bacterium]|nr:NUDIX hydrolase [Alphaproteobacteria bacterium]
MADNIIPAATIIIAREVASGFEVFMVKRHHQIDFVAGALVFPGGKAAKDDFDPGLAEFTDGGDTFSEDMRALGAAAIREAFEESGILFARAAGEGGIVSADRVAALEPYRKALDSREISLLEFLRKENLRLAYDQLAHFAHWITPKNMPKRFDTHFFLARAPEGHAGLHDGHESVDSIWITPDAAVADRKKWNVIFPTKLNLMKLAGAPSLDEAMTQARVSRPLTVEPWVENGPDGQILRIREDAGYTQTTALMKDAT